MGRSRASQRLGRRQAAVLQPARHASMMGLPERRSTTWNMSLAASGARQVYPEDFLSRSRRESWHPVNVRIAQHFHGDRAFRARRMRDQSRSMRTDDPGPARRHCRHRAYVRPNGMTPVRMSPVTSGPYRRCRTCISRHPYQHKSRPAPIGARADSRAASSWSGCSTCAADTGSTAGDPRRNSSALAEMPTACRCGAERRLPARLCDSGDTRDLDHCVRMPAGTTSSTCQASCRWALPRPRHRLLHRGAVRDRRSMPHRHVRPGARSRPGRIIRSARGSDIMARSPPTARSAAEARDGLHGSTTFVAHGVVLWLARRP